MHQLTLQVALDLYDTLLLLLEHGQQFHHFSIVHLVQLFISYGNNLVTALKTAVALAIRLDEITIATPTYDAKARPKLS